jgi:hypothetical protein
VMQMAEALMQYRKLVTDTIKTSEESATAAQRCGKRAAEALTEINETIAQRLAKLL